MNTFIKPDPVTTHKTDFYGEIEFSGSLPVATMQEVKDEIERLLQEIEGRAGIEFMSVKWISDQYGVES